MAWAYTDHRESALTRALRSARSGWKGLGPAWMVVVASLALTVLGVKSIDVAESLRPAEGGLGLGPVASRQLVYGLVGMAACAAVCVPRYRALGPFVWIFFAIAMSMLVFLVVPGVPASVVRPRGGARAWIDLGPVDFQPSEVMKVAYVLALSWYLRYRKNHRTLKGLFWPGLFTALPVGLIMLQPDLGTAILFVPALFFILIAAGARTKHLVLVVACAALAAPAVYPALKPHQKQRIVGLLLQLRGDRSEDLDINMQSVTAQRMIGAGGVVGVSDAEARALHRFNALPERHNDMVLAPLVTRWGLLGGLGALGLYVLWSVGALLTSARCLEPFGRLICVGSLGFLFAQVMVNVGMNLGLLPIIGITLPYVSHGGSSMLAQWLVTGLIVNVSLRREGYDMGRSFEWNDDEES
ncbi:MAG TPA: FtsW/RodA/SpoVE family cell cycle protein [Phycisphaerales bacterium]|nr:FtsW/RodA/SpoVE family cell cycle protein [Phycisphaerales bacterium]